MVKIEKAWEQRKSGRFHGWSGRTFLRPASANCVRVGVSIVHENFLKFNHSKLFEK